ncbi:sh3 and f-bar domain-containing protein [Anaeramoeba ignava]|uniref:Sh3 and f-bar domain-containing protein n=1 Tax=Anaeramoeba ignava TaxID=1746090 RepID=A0A9Q0LHV3_ANAIG|nr:sh3 and f-bar domain-containing protein [Anaeramoeba ignava]|eukprot:Anaeramoba_ignava/a480058_111.p1 GENE.a480058_111~~a480058_111.p1  ORF type:complete len:459 (+),score=190.88 a480058_111:121-1497(+)
MSFGVDLWDQYEVVKKQVHTSFHELREISEFLQKVSKLQDNFGKSLFKLTQSIRPSDIEGTTQNAWGALITTLEGCANSNIDYAQHIFSEISSPILSFKDESSPTRKELFSTCDKKTRELKMLKSKFETATQKSSKADSDVDGFKGSNDSKSQAKLDKLKKAAAKATDEKNTAQSNYESFKKSYYSEIIPKTLSELQKLEEERMNLLKKQFEKFVEYSKTKYISSLDQLIQRFDTTVCGVNVNKDIESFIDKNKTLNRNPVVQPKQVQEKPKIEFEDTNESQVQETQTQSPPPVITQDPLPQQTNPMISPANQVLEEDENDEDSSESEGEECDFLVKAFYDYAGAEESDLVFSQNDIIRVVRKHSTGWWEGIVDGKQGLFPSNFVEPLDEQQKTSDVEQINIGDKCRALYDYSKEADGELDLKEGDIITIKGNEGGWFLGVNEKGIEGTFPGNYVEKV